jgi:hypothetical protein
VHLPKEIEPIMFSVRTVSSLVLATLAASFAAGCTVKTSDDVYTGDEHRSDIAAIARDEASFPLRVGTAVPDADGNAVALSPTMEGVRVRFLEIRADETCDSDSDGAGEFYFDFGINHRSVGRRDASQYLSIHRDEVANVDATRVFFVEPNETFTVRLDVNEDDDMFNGADDHVGTREIPYQARDLQNSTSWRTTTIGSGDCRVTVTYTLDRVQ